MSWLDKFKNIWKSKPTPSNPTANPSATLDEEISRLMVPQGQPISLQLINDHAELERIKDSKKLLQRLDELITNAEADIDRLTADLEKISAEEDSLRSQIKAINQSGSWKERALLLKLERTLIQKRNSQQRLEIYNQNIRVYQNLIARIEDMVAMKMDGINETRIESVWLDYSQHLEQYSERILSGEISDEPIAITSNALEQRLNDLRSEIFGLPREKVRPTIEEAKENKNEEKKTEAAPAPPRQLELE